MSKAVVGVGVVLAAGVTIWALGLTHTSAQSDSDKQNQPKPEKKTAPPAQRLVAQGPKAQAPRVQARPDPNQPIGDFVQDTIVIPHCQLNVDEKTELSSQREGVLLFVGRPVNEGEVVRHDHAGTYLFKGKPHPYRRLKEGDPVEPDDILGRIDDRLALDEQRSKENNLKAAKADLELSKKTRDEAKNRYETQQALSRSGATSKEDLRAGLLGWEEYKSEVEQKEAAIGKA